MAECIKVIKTWEKTHAKPVKGIGAAGSTLTLYLPPPDADLIAQMQSLTDKFGDRKSTRLNSSHSSPSRMPSSA